MAGKSNYIEIKSCRVAKDSHNLLTVLSLGHQALTGVFPKSKEEKITSGPLDLVWCSDSGLLQLKHSYDPSEMYGENYGYRSGLNASMVEHLTSKVSYLESLACLRDGSTVLDIGSNDCSTLKAYSNKSLERIGVDPTGEKFREYYPGGFKLVPDFFTADSYFTASKNRASVVTSIAMFYDLDDPVKFAADIESVLDDEGIWHFEQSYMPSMLRLNSYDTICHEHVEYYSLGVVSKILSQAGLKVIDVNMNSVNGGSFAVTACKTSCNTYMANHAVIDWMLDQEDRMGLNTPRPYRLFEERVYSHRDDLLRLIRSLVADGKKVLGYGASTKGNAVLQFCGLSSAEIPAIAEVNPDKFGRYTPGTHIPIISESDARAMKPDYFLVLPWHFKDGILRREKEFLNSGGKFIFPFPEIEIV